MTTWYTADTHYNHKNIIGYCNRPWANVDEMTAGLIANWNSRVTNEDSVYMLGDFAFCNMTKQQAILAQLNGKVKIVLPGNHDSSSEHLLKAGFDVVVGARHTRTIAGQKVRLNHFPYQGSGVEQHDDRFFKEMPQDDGSWLLHGHVHTAWKQKTRQINVGVDVWGYLPVSEEEIARIIRHEVNYEDSWSGHRKVAADYSGPIVICNSCGKRSTQIEREGMSHTYENGNCKGYWRLQPSLFEV